MSEAQELFNRLTATAAEELPEAQKRETMDRLGRELSEHGNEALTYLTGALTGALMATSAGDNSANTALLIRVCCDAVALNIEKRAEVKPSVLNVASVKAALQKVGEVVAQRVPISGTLPAALVRIAEIRERQAAQ